MCIFKVLKNLIWVWGRGRGGGGRGGRKEKKRFVWWNNRNVWDVDFSTFLNSILNLIHQSLYSFEMSHFAAFERHIWSKIISFYEEKMEKTSKTSIKISKFSRWQFYDFARKSFVWQSFFLSNFLIEKRSEQNEFLPEVF